MYVCMYVCMYAPQPIPRPRSKPPPHPPSSGDQGSRRDQIDVTRMQLGMINYENVSTIVDSMTHKSGDPAASNQENGEQKGGGVGAGNPDV